jgi:hypothetical protein
MTALRAKSICTKVTEDEYAMFEPKPPARPSATGPGRRAGQGRHDAAPTRCFSPNSNDRPVTVEVMQRVVYLRPISRLPSGQGGRRQSRDRQLLHVLERIANHVASTWK